MNMYFGRFLGNGLSILILATLLVEGSYVPSMKNVGKSITNGHSKAFQQPAHATSSNQKTKGTETNMLYHNTYNYYTTQPPEREGSTDIPEEKEIGEDPTTSVDGLTQRTESNYGTDPIEQHDAHVTRPMVHPTRPPVHKPNHPPPQSFTPKSHPPPAFNQKGHPPPAFNSRGHQAPDVKSNGHPPAMNPNYHPPAMKPNVHPPAMKPNGHPPAMKPNGHPPAMKPNGHPPARKPNGHPPAMNPNGHPPRTPYPVYKPVVTPKPTPRPDPIVHARPTTSEPIVTEEVEVEEGAYPAGHHNGHYDTATQSSQYYDPYDPYGHGYEQEDSTSPQRNNSPRTEQTETCPMFAETTMEHHIILRHDGCEILLSQDDAIRWHGAPGSSPPIAFVRSYSTSA